MKALSWLTVLIMFATACGGDDTSMSPVDVNVATTSAAPATTSYLLTTTLAGQPSLGDGPENPAPVGEPMSVGGWNTAVVGRTTEEPTPEGGSGVQVAVRVTARYVRNDGGRAGFLDDLVISALGWGGVHHGLVQQGCPDPLLSGASPVVGEVIEGNLCFVIDVEVGDLLLVLEDPRSPTRHRVFLATE